MNSQMNQSFTCVIVGAGISGLMAARALHTQGINVIVLDKARGVGGRLATRWVETAQNDKGYFDHGAQFFTVRDARFQSFVDEWLTAGIVREWSRGFAQGNGAANNDGHPRYCATAGMNSIARHLAQGMEVRVQTKVERLSHADGQWQIGLEGATTLHSDALIMTTPAPQALTLLEAGAYELPTAARMAVERIRYDPCFALMVVLDAPPRLPEPGALQLQTEPITWIADNHRKGISPDVFTLTIHAGPEFTRQHWDSEPEIIARKMLHAASAWVRVPVKSWQLHRWRYSQPQIVHPDACLFVDERAPLVFAGDAFGAPRVEGATLSGLAAADALLEWISTKS